MKPKVFIDISNIPELWVINRLDSAIEVGIAVNIPKLIDTLEDRKTIDTSVSDQGKVIYNKYIVFKSIVDHLKKVALWIHYKYSEYWW